MAEPALAHDEPDYYYTDMPVGEILRRAREHYGQSIADIERALRIRASQIEAIESGDLSRLPGPVYAIGFVRSYADYLGLGGEKMVRLFKMQTGDVGDKKPELRFHTPAKEAKVPPLWLVLASLAVAFGVLAGWGIYNGEDRTLVTSVPELPAQIRDRVAADAAKKEVMGPPAPASLAAASPPAVVAPAGPGIILNVKENSWVEIVDGEGKPIVSRALKSGDQYFVPDRPDLKMSLGNAGGIEILIDGAAIPPIGKSGEIKRDIPLDSQALKTGN